MGVLVDQVGELVGDGLSSGVLVADCLSPVMDVDGHVHGLQAGCVPGVSEGPARTVVAGREFDLTDAEADRVADFITGLIAARDLH